jgi:two-component system nitrogen regulation response regulator GlnG
MEETKKILVVDDEENIRWVFKQALEKKHFTVHTADGAEAAIDKIKANDYLLVFSDIFMGGMSGLDLLDKIREIRSGLKVVVMTAQDTMNNTIEAMRRGAYDYISKPFDFDEIYRLVDKAVENVGIADDGDGKEDDGDFAVASIVGKSKKMQEVFKTIGRSAMSDLAVLITGDSGTGKEMVARALHLYSGRVKEPFICINCAAIARELLESELFGHEKGAFTGAVETKIGKFELANGGTLFLDEIGDMDIQLQAKILRVLQDSEFYRVGGKVSVRVNVRIIAATNQNLEDLMAKKLFRSDLFHRLNVIHIDLPPLRERPGDIPLLANHFLSRYSGELARGKVYLSPEAERIFKTYSWPGNIREMENVVKRGLVLASSGPLLPEHLPPQILAEVHSLPADATAWEMRMGQLLRDFLDQYPDWESRDDLHDRLIGSVEKQLFKILLEKFRGKQIAAAKILGINRSTLKRKIDAMDLPTRKRSGDEPSP